MTTAIEYIVMSRVHRIHTLRRVFGATAMKAYGLAVLCVALLSSVSVASIYTNMMGLSAPTQMGQYLVGALMHTEWIVQLLLVGTVVAFVMLVRDVLRGVSGRIAVPFVRV